MVQRYIKQLNAVTSAEEAAEIITRCADDGVLVEVLPKLEHDYIVDGTSRGYMAALVSLHAKREIILDLRDGTVSCKNPVGSATISHSAYTEGNQIMENLFLSGEDMEE